MSRTIPAPVHVHLSDHDKVTRANQVVEGFYRLEDGSVFVVNPDGEGRHWYDNLDAAIEDWGQPSDGKVRHIRSHQLHD
jgi:hypothetical protein